MKARRERLWTATLVVVLVCVLVVATFAVQNEPPGPSSAVNSMPESVRDGANFPILASQGNIGDSSYALPRYNIPYTVETTAVCLEGPYAYVALGDRIVIYDVSTPAQPAYVGRTGKLHTPVNDVACVPGYVYVGVSRQWYIPQPHVDAGQMQPASIVVFDVTNPQAPAVSDWVESLSGAHDLAVDGQALFVAVGEDGLRLIDLQDPAHPVDAGTVSFTNAIAVAASNGYAYVSDKGDYFFDPQPGGTPTPNLTVMPVVDTPEPYEAPAIHVLDASAGFSGIQEVGSLELMFPAVKVAVAAPQAYLAVFSGLEVLDISDPASPFRLGSMPIAGDDLLDIAFASPYIVLAERWVDDWEQLVGLEIVDVSSPRAPVAIGSAAMWDGAMAVAVAGEHVFAAAGDGLRVYDVTDPANPVLAAGAEVTRSWVHDVAVVGQHAYVLDMFRGLTVYDISTPSAPAQVAAVPIHAGDLAVEGAVDVVGDRAYVAVENRLLVFDITNPSAPTQLGESDELWPLAMTITDLAVAGDYAYMATGEFERGLIVLDVSNPADPVGVATLELLYVIGATVDGNYAYLAGVDGLRVLDVSDPSNPQEVAVAEPRGLSYLAKIGSNVYTTEYARGVLAFDVSNPNSPIHVGSLGMEMRGSMLGAHQGYLYAGTALDGIQIVDGSNPTAMNIVATIEEPGYGFGVDFDGGYAYVTNGDGFSVVDISNPLDPVVVYSEDSPG